MFLFVDKPPSLEYFDYLISKLGLQSHFFSPDSLKNINMTLIKSDIYYCCTIWVRCFNIYFKKFKDCKIKKTREGFLRKHSCGFIFFKLCYTPIFLKTCLFN